MRFKVYFLLISIFFVSAIAPKKQIKIFLVGDSTMANKLPEKYPETGWGQVFNQFFNDRVTVINKAVNGRSTKSFIAENKWRAVLDSLQKDNYVFIQFGHNDEKVSNEKLGTTLEEYRGNLIKYIMDTRSKEAIPVLLTPVERRIFKNKQFYESHGGYPDIVRKVAAEYQVPLIDMQKKSMEYIIGFGIKSSLKLFLHADSGVLVNYPTGIKDNTHFSEEGAKAMASIAVEGIKELKLPLVKFLNK